MTTDQEIAELEALAKQLKACADSREYPGHTDLYDAVRAIEDRVRLERENAELRADIQTEQAAHTLTLDSCRRLEAENAELRAKLAVPLPEEVIDFVSGGREVCGAFDMDTVVWRRLNDSLDMLESLARRVADLEAYVSGLEKAVVARTQDRLR